MAVRVSETFLWRSWLVVAVLALFVFNFFYQSKKTTGPDFATPWFFGTFGFGLLSAGLAALYWNTWQRQRRMTHWAQEKLDAERQRLSQDLHDGLGAHLARIIYLVEAAKIGEPTQPESCARMLERIAESSRRAVGEIDELIWITDPKYNYLNDLVAHLRNYAAQVAEEAGFDATIQFPRGVPNLPVQTELRRNLLLILKESLQNVLKHSHANHVKLRFSIGQREVVLEIDDDGRGFRTENAEKKGNGLANMQARAETLGGSFTYDSVPGRGTRIHVVCPLDLEERHPNSLLRNGKTDPNRWGTHMPEVSSPV